MLQASRTLDIKKLTTILLSLSFFLSQAQEFKVDSIHRPVSASYSLEAGRRNVRSTYLSPNLYGGLDLAISGHWAKALPFAPHRAMMAFDARGAVWPRLLNPGHNASMQGFDLEFAWAMRAYWNIPHGFYVSVGGGPEIGGGTLLLLRNSNNPVGVNLHAALSLSASAGYSTRIGRLPLEILWCLRTPLAGAFFMPGYGETYYEIYVGNHSGLVHAAWPGNMFRLDSRLTARLRLGRYAIEAGYRYRTSTAKANNLVTSMFSHSFMLGWTL